MTTSISIKAEDWRTLRAGLLTDDGNENSAALLCGLSKGEKDARLLVRQIEFVNEDEYLARNKYHLRVAPSFYNRIIQRCIKDGLTPIIAHSHPHHGEAWYSASDDFGEQNLMPVLGDLIPNAFPATLVITHDQALGRRFVNGQFEFLDGMRIVGQRYRKIRFGDSAESVHESKDQFDRQVRAFGKDGQKTIESLKVAIVGVGGIGSVVTEQVARLGVSDIVLIDPDQIEASNLSRLFGASQQDVGHGKADTLQRFARMLGADARGIPDSALKQDILVRLRDRDLIFSCVDNDRTRATLNRFAHQYFIPVIDQGIRIDARNGHVTAAAGRVSIVGPGLVCLRCSHHLNSERIRAESLPIEERKRLQLEGYVMGIDEPAPAVISLNTTLAGLGVTAAINLFVDLTGAPQPLSQLYDATRGMVFTSQPVHEPSCDVCGEDGVEGLGDKQIVSAY
jgi:molybdopterin/thiamine biosynthesis adenylyltransferase